jgi:hypothetical protein
MKERRMKTPKMNNQMIQWILTVEQKITEHDKDES